MQTLEMRGLTGVQTGGGVLWHWMKERLIEALD
jgi:hypothetical protein